MTDKTIDEVMEYKYKNRKDKDNIFGVGISDAEFREFIIDYLLGKNWYVTDPLGQTQINEIALRQILEKWLDEHDKQIRDSVIEIIKKYIRLKTKYADRQKEDYILAHDMYEWLEELKEQNKEVSE